MPEVSGPKTLILDLYGAYSRRLGNWFAVADLVTLMNSLGLDDQAVRSAVSRMTRRGLLLRDSRAGVRGYRLSDETLEVMQLGDRRIFGSMDPARLEDGWAMVSFSVPENESSNRYLLRSRLEWLGFGNISKGLWIAPRRVLDELRDTIQRLGFERYVDVFVGYYHDFQSIGELVARAWDLEGLNRMYAEFLDDTEPIGRRWSRKDLVANGERAFVDYTLLLHRWRKLPFLDPGLPSELLPPQWKGRTAVELFHRMRVLLEDPAFEYVRRLVTIL